MTISNSHTTGSARTWVQRGRHWLVQHRVLLLTLAAMSLVLLLRKPYAFIDPQLWAEDALILQQQRELGLRAWVTPHAGYLILTQRWVAQVAAAAPLWATPIIYNYAAWLLLLASAARLMNDRTNLPHKPLLALGLVLVPHQSAEVFVNLTNIQWPMALLLWHSAIQDPPSRPWSPEAWFDFALLVMISLTGPFGIFALPLFMLRYLSHQDRYSLTLLGLSLMTTVLQLCLVIAFFERSTEPRLPVEMGVWVQMLAGRFAAHLIVPAPLLRQIGLLTLPLALSVVLMSWAAVARQRVHRRPLAGLLLFALLAVAATAFKARGNPAVLLDPDNGPRYSYIPLVAVAWCLCTALRCEWRTLRAASALMLLMMLINTASTGLMEPRWQEDHWKRATEALQPGQRARIAINPPGWYVDIERSD